MGKIYESQEDYDEAVRKQIKITLDANRLA